MSGEQAAASLFGSDDASSDPFANLGSNTGVAEADGLFSGQPDVGFTVDEGDPFGSSVGYEPQGSVQDVYGQRNGSQALGSAYEQYKPVQPAQGGQYSWDSQRTARPTYAADSQPTPTAASSYATAYSNAYTPQTYAPPVPIAQPTPPTNANTFTNPYTPPTYSTPAPNYAPQSIYSPPAQVNPYAPTSTTSVPPPPQPSYSAPPPVSHTPYGGSVSAPPPAPAATVPISRPKVPNAYDPPFLPSKPTRRASKPAPSQPVYNPYQSPPPTNYPPPPPASHHQPANPYQEPTQAGHGYPQAPPEQPLRQPAVPPPPPARMASPYAAAYTPQAPPPSQPPPPRAYSPVVASKLPPPPKKEPSESPTIASAHAVNGVHEPYAPQRYGSPVGTLGRPSSRSHARNSSVGSIGSIGSVTKTSPKATSPPPPQATSPSMIPLPYSPEPGTQSPEVSSSPEISAKSLSHYSPYSPPLPQPLQQAAQIAMAPPKKAPVHDPYAPSLVQHANNFIPRTSSPLHNEYVPGQTRKSSVSTNVNGSFTLTSPYNPISRSIIPVPSIPKPLNLDDPSHHTLSPSHEHGIRPTVSQYAPSPSLLGANDPLARTSARAPVITFGFGGKMVTCFHGMPGLNTGFDVALSARTTSELKVRVLQKILPDSALHTPGTGAVYPGPLVSDPGASALSLIKSGANAQAKKAAVLAYLTSRADEIGQGLGYLAPEQRKRAESKMILVKLLKVLVEHDGRLLGVPQAEVAVRQALVPRLDSEPALQDGVSLQAAYQVGSSDEAALSVTSVRPSMLEKIEDFLLQGDRRQAYHYAMDQKLWAHAMVLSSSIDKEAWKEVVNEFLRSELGSGPEQSNGLPGGAEPKSWESLRVAYSLFSGQGSAAVQELASPASLQKLATTGLLQPPATPSLPSLTPRTPNFTVIQPPLNISVESLSQWAETAAMMVSSPLTPETSAALTSLGDQLLARDWVDAAHACYLLSPQTSAVAGHSTPGARITLIGSKNPANAFKDPDSVIFAEVLEFTMSLVPATKGQEPFRGLPYLQAFRFVRAVWFAEIGDLQMANRYCEAIAASLGQSSPYTTHALVEQLTGLKQRLSGVFHGDKSNSWIGNKLTKPSLDSIGGWLEGRFTKLVTGDSETPTVPDEKNKPAESQYGPFAHYSTISSSTPSERSSPQPQSHVPAYAAAAGAAHPRASSEIASSPYAPPPPERSNSALGYSRTKPSTTHSTPSSNYSFPSSQSSPNSLSLNGSAMGYTSNSDPYAPQDVSDDLETPMQSHNASWWGSGDDSTEGNATNTQTPTASTFLHPTDGGSFGGGGDGSVETSSDGFISLMDNHSFAFESGPSSRQSLSSTPAGFDEEGGFDEEDLGLGNSKNRGKDKAKVEGEVGGGGSPTAAAPAQPKAAPKPEEKAAEKPAAAAGGGSSWFRWFNRSESAGAPVKASLGEQSSFYYDKELKKWVNKTSGPEETKPTPPPPPPRAQTASPGMAMSGRSMHMPPSVGSGPPTRPSSVNPGGTHAPPHATPPPPRSKSTIDLSTDPPEPRTNQKAPPNLRVRSNLAPPGADSVPGTPLMLGDMPGVNGNGPPPSRPRSQASRKNVRSRYVDVFQQEGAGA